MACHFKWGIFVFSQVPGEIRARFCSARFLVRYATPLLPDPLTQLNNEQNNALSFAPLHDTSDPQRSLLTAEPLESETRVRFPKQPAFFRRLAPFADVQHDARGARVSLLQPDEERTAGAMAAQESPAGLEGLTGAPPHLTSVRTSCRTDLPPCRRAAAERSAAGTQAREDRFIPHRSAMDFDGSNFELTKVRHTTGHCHPQSLHPPTQHQHTIDLKLCT